ncbi:MAG: SDR family oxidoreductase [Sphingobium sp.]
MGDRLKGRVAIITGASSGIGKAAAKAFADEGARLILAARRKEKLEELAAGLTGADILVRPTDVTSEEDVAGLFADAEAFGPIDLLVNNAGSTTHGSAIDMTMQVWRDTIELNLTSVFMCAREAMKVMIPRGRGRIINIGSISAQVPRNNAIAYTASKFGVEGLTRGLALEGREHGITVSIIHPGSTVSELAGQAEDPSRAGPKTMMGSTVASAIVTMAAMPDDASMLTSIVIPIAQPYLGRG